MTTPLLVRHPAPFQTESLLGYVLRLSEVNGYPTPWNLYQHAGVRQSEARTTGMSVAKIALVTGRPISELNRIGFAPPEGSPRSCRLLGHPLTTMDLGLKNPGICTACVKEKGFVEAFWHLELMVGCPIHMCELVSSCARCTKPLRWFRPGLLECSCGSDLSQQPAAPIPSHVASLLDLIRRRTIGVSASKGSMGPVPEDDLMEMDLRCLLRVIRTLGKYHHGPRTILRRRSLSFSAKPCIASGSFGQEGPLASRCPRTSP